METVVVPKQVFNRILFDVETLITDVEIALDSKAQQRISEIETEKVAGKTESDYYNYLSKRGIKLGKVRN